LLLTNKNLFKFSLSIRHR